MVIYRETIYGLSAIYGTTRNIATRRTRYVGPIFVHMPMDTIALVLSLFICQWIPSNWYSPSTSSQSSPSVVSFQKSLISCVPSPFWIFGVSCANVGSANVIKTKNKIMRTMLHHSFAKDAFLKLNQWNICIN